MRERFPHTFDHRNCPACEHALKTQASPLAVDLTFAEAFERWVGRRVFADGDPETDARYISPRTEQDLRQYAGSAGKMLGRLRLDEIHLGHLREYQRARALCDQEAAPFAQRAGANLIRKEIQTVIRVLDAAGLWNDETERSLIRVQAVETSVPCAPSAEEQEHLLEVASSREEWATVYWYSLLSLQTTAATNEMRSLRLGDVVLGRGATIRVRGKNRYRNRTIPVRGGKARGALERLVDRAKSLGAKAAEDYLFPLHLTWDRYDARKPMTVWGLRKPWEEVREAAGMPLLHIYHLRHMGLTRMAEEGAPVHVLMAFAGHMSMRMQRHYVSISMAAKEEWAERVWGGGDGDELPPKKGPQSVRPGAAQMLLAGD